jgi:hypothetical protein
MSPMQSAGYFPSGIILYIVGSAVGGQRLAHTGRGKATSPL